MSDIGKMGKIETLTDYFNLKICNETYIVNICFCKRKGFFDNQFVESFLDNEEIKCFESLIYERRINSFILGRYSAKKAVSDLTREEDLKKISIRNGVFNQPIIVCDSCSNAHISLTHCDVVGAAVVFSDKLILGIDFEKLSQRFGRVLEPTLTQNEKELMCRPYLYKNSHLLIWTVKESISKALKTGLTIPLSILEIKEIIVQDGYFFSTFVNFPQYCSISFIIKEYACSITYPQNAEISTDIYRINYGLRKLICG